MLIIRKYFLIKVISVVTSITCERTWSQVMYETCMMQDSSRRLSVQSVQSLAVVPTCSRVMKQPCFISTQKKRYHALKAAPLSKNSISKMCNYLNFKC